VDFLMEERLGDDWMKAARRFIVLTIPRTGSNYLCSLLNSHPEVLCHHEVFNASGIFCSLDLRSRSAYYFGTLEERDRDPVGFLERLWNRSFGRRAVGIKLCRGQNRAALEAVLADPEIAKIVMRRRNRVKTYVSEMVAQLTGEWESYPGIRPPGERLLLPVPAAGLFRWIEHTETWYDEIARRLAGGGQTALDVAYEDLFGEKGPAAVRRVLEHLDVAADASALAGATRRQSPIDLRGSIANFDELAAALQGTELEGELHAVGL
jgi:LPS sulfotransferase NodH